MSDSYELLSTQGKFEMAKEISAFRAGKAVTRQAGKMRKASEMSVKGFAQEVGISPATIRRMEAKRYANLAYSPRFATVVKLANYAGVPLNQFILS